MTSSEGKYKDNVVSFYTFLSIDLTGENFVENNFSGSAVLYSEYWKMLDWCFFGTNVMWYNDLATWKILYFSESPLTHFKTFHGHPVTKCLCLRVHILVLGAQI